MESDMRLRLGHVILAVTLVALIAAMICCAGCPKRPETVNVEGGGAGPATPSGGEGAAPSSESYVFIGISTGAEYWRAADAGLMDACEALGVTGDFRGPTTQDAQEQAEIMAQVIGMKPAGILIAPGRPDTLTPYINDAVEQGVPVICLDTDAPESDRIAYFGTDNYQAGRTGASILARLIQEAHPDDWAAGKTFKVAISSRPGQWNLDERVRGYEEYFSEEAPQIEVVQVFDDETLANRGEEKASAVLSAHPDLAGFAGVNAVSGLGIAAALKNADAVGKVQVVAMDGDEGILELIDEGVIQASVAQRQYWMSYLGAAYLYGLKHGVFTAPDGDGVDAEGEIPAEIDTTTVEVNKDNLDAFRTPSQGAKETMPEEFKAVIDQAKGA
jgi:ribose transport system substrate-binding protein